MLDRAGKPIVVAWPEHHLLWLEACNQLSAYDRSQAFYDIAALTGRSIGAVREKANKMRLEKIQADWLRNAPAMTASAGPGYKARLGPSELARPSMARLMGSR
jgi:hypothetical protein